MIEYCKNEKGEKYYLSTLNLLAKEISKEYNVKGAIVILIDKNGKIKVDSDGLNIMEIENCFTTALYYNKKRQMEIDEETKDDTF